METESTPNRKKLQIDIKSNPTKQGEPQKSPKATKNQDTQMKKHSPPQRTEKHVTIVKINYPASPLQLNQDAELSPKIHKNLTSKHSKKQYLSPVKKSETLEQKKNQNHRDEQVKSFDNADSVTNTQIGNEDLNPMEMVDSNLYELAYMKQDQIGAKSPASKEAQQNVPVNPTSQLQKLSFTASQNAYPLTAENMEQIRESIKIQKLKAHVRFHQQVHHNNSVTTQLRKDPNFIPQGGGTLNAISQPERFLQIQEVDNSSGQGASSKMRAAHSTSLNEDKEINHYFTKKDGSCTNSRQHLGSDQKNGKLNQSVQNDDLNDVLKKNELTTRARKIQRNRNLNLSSTWRNMDSMYGTYGSKFKNNLNHKDKIQMISNRLEDCTIIQSSLTNFSEIRVTGIQAKRNNKITKINLPALDSRNSIQGGQEDDEKEIKTNQKILTDTNTPSHLSRSIHNHQFSQITPQNLNYLRVSPKYKNLVFNSIDVKNNKSPQKPTIETIHNIQDLNSRQGSFLQEVLKSRKLDSNKQRNISQSIQAGISMQKPRYQKKAIRTVMWQSGHLRFPNLSPNAANKHLSNRALFARQLIDGRRDTGSQMKKSFDLSKFDPNSYDADTELLKVKVFDITQPNLNPNFDLSLTPKQVQRNRENEQNASQALTKFVLKESQQKREFKQGHVSVVSSYQIDDNTSNLTPSQTGPVPLVAQLNSGGELAPNTFHSYISKQIKMEDSFIYSTEPRHQHSNDSIVNKKAQTQLKYKLTQKKRINYNQLKDFEALKFKGPQTISQSLDNKQEMPGGNLENPPAFDQQIKVDIMKRKQQNQKTNRYQGHQSQSQGKYPTAQAQLSASQYSSSNNIKPPTNASLSTKLNLIKSNQKGKNFSNEEVNFLEPKQGIHLRNKFAHNFENYEKNAISSPLNPKADFIVGGQTIKQHSRQERYVPKQKKDCQHDIVKETQPAEQLRQSQIQITIPNDKERQQETPRIHTFALDKTLVIKQQAASKNLAEGVSEYLPVLPVEINYPNPLQQVPGKAKKDTAGPSEAQSNQNIPAEGKTDQATANNQDLNQTRNPNDKAVQNEIDSSATLRQPQIGQNEYKPYRAGSKQSMKIEAIIKTEGNNETQYETQQQYQVTNDAWSNSKDDQLQISHEIQKGVQHIEPNGGDNQDLEYRMETGNVRSIDSNSTAGKSNNEKIDDNEADPLAKFDISKAEDSNQYVETIQNPNERKTGDNKPSTILCKNQNESNQPQPQQEKIIKLKQNILSKNLQPTRKLKSNLSLDSTELFNDDKYSQSFIQDPKMNMSHVMSQNDSTNIANRDPGQTQGPQSISKKIKLKIPKKPIKQMPSKFSLQAKNEKEQSTTNPTMKSSQLIHYPDNHAEAGTQIDGPMLSSPQSQMHKWLPDKHNLPYANVARPKQAYSKMIVVQNSQKKDEYVSVMNENENMSESDCTQRFLPMLQPVQQNIESNTENTRYQNQKHSKRQSNNDATSLQKQYNEDYFDQSNTQFDSNEYIMNQGQYMTQAEYIAMLRQANYYDALKLQNSRQLENKSIQPFDGISDPLFLSQIQYSKSKNLSKRFNTERNDFHEIIGPENFIQTNLRKLEDKIEQMTKQKHQDDSSLQKIKLDDKIEIKYQKKKKQPQPTEDSKDGLATKSPTNSKGKAFINPIVMQQLPFSQAFQPPQHHKPQDSPSLSQSYPEAPVPRLQKRKQIVKYYNNVQTLLKEKPDAKFRLFEDNANKDVLANDEEAKMLMPVETYSSKSERSSRSATQLSKKKKNRSKRSEKKQIEGQNDFSTQNSPLNSPAKLIDGKSNKIGNASRKNLSGQEIEQKQSAEINLSPWQ